MHESRTPYITNKVLCMSRSTSARARMGHFPRVKIQCYYSTSSHSVFLKQIIVLRNRPISVLRNGSTSSTFLLAVVLYRKHQEKTISSTVNLLKNSVSPDKLLDLVRKNTRQPVKFELHINNKYFIWNSNLTRCLIFYLSTLHSR